MTNLAETLPYQMSAEGNYQLLLQLSEAFSQASEFQEDTGMIRGAASDINVSVVSRDLRQRPGRVGLVTATPGQSAEATLGSVAIEIQLYHEHQLAVPLAFQENTKFRSAFDNDGRILASRLAELTDMLGLWLRNQLQPGIG